MSSDQAPFQLCKRLSDHASRRSGTREVQSELAPGQREASCAVVAIALVEKQLANGLSCSLVGVQTASRRQTRYTERMAHGKSTHGASELVRAFRRQDLLVETLEPQPM